MERMINRILDMIDHEITEWTFDFPEEQQEELEKKAYEMLKRELGKD